MHGPRAVVVFLIWIGMLSGCASAPHWHAPYVSDELKAHLGTVGVVAVRSLPDTEFGMPGRAGAFGRGAVFGTGAVLSGNVYPEDTYLKAMGLLLTPVGTLAGALVGAANAESSDELAGAETHLRKALVDLNVPARIRDGLLSAAEDQKPCTMVMLDNAWVMALNESKRYESLADSGIDTLLEIQVPRVGFEGKYAVDPRFALVMSVRVKLVRLSDRTLLLDHTIEYENKNQLETCKLIDWSKDDAKLFRRVISRCSPALGERIIEELFTSHLPL